MQLFHGRPLAVTGAAILAFAAAAFFLPGVALYAGAAAAVLLLGLLLFFVRRRRFISPFRTLSVGVSLGLFALFVLRAAFFYFGTYRPAAALAGGTYSVHCTVTERQYLNSYSSTYLVRLQQVGDTSLDSYAVLDCDFASDYPVGTRLSLDAVSVEAAADAYAGNVSDGIYLLLQADNSLGVQEEGSITVGGWHQIFTKWNRRLASRLRQAVGGREGDLCVRMLLGGSDTPAEVRRDFRRSGVSHVLSVSGMHLSLLCGALNALLLRLRVGKKGRIFALALFVVGYLCLLDFPASALRSGLMLLLSYGIFLCEGDADGMTSLFLSLSVIVFVQPTAVLDSGFILSGCATFGILSLGPLYNGLYERYRRYLRTKPQKAGKESFWSRLWEKVVLFFLHKILPSLGLLWSANLMTAVPVAFLYGRISLLSPVSNLIVPLPAEAAVLLSALTLLFPEGSFVQGMAAYYAKKTAGFLLWVTGKLSDVRGAELSLRDPFLLWTLILATAATLVLLCIRLRHRGFTAAPFAAAMLCMAGYVCFAVPDTVHVFFRESGTEDAMAAVAHGTAVVADFTSGSGRALKETAALAEEAGATEVEVLLLTHYHARHVGSVEKLLCSQKVRRLWLPEPRTQTDASVFLRLLQMAEDRGVECRLYGAEDSFVIFETLTLDCSGPAPISRSTHPALALRLSQGAQSLLYWGKSAEENENLAAWLPGDGKTDVLLGNHGPVQKQSFAPEVNAGGIIHVFSTDKLAYLVGGRDPAPYFGKIRLHDTVAYFAFHVP